MHMRMPMPWPDAHPHTRQAHRIRSLARVSHGDETQSSRGALAERPDRQKLHMHEPILHPDQYMSYTQDFSGLLCVGVFWQAGTMSRCRRFQPSPGRHMPHGSSRRVPESWVRLVCRRAPVAIAMASPAGTRCSDGRSVRDASQSITCSRPVPMGWIKPPGDRRVAGQQACPSPTSAEQSRTGIPKVIILYTRLCRHLSLLRVSLQQQWAGWMR
jgi:hypothetical protein